MTHARRLVAIPILVLVVVVLILSERVHQALVGLLTMAQELAAGHSVAAVREATAAPAPVGA